MSKFNVGDVVRCTRTSQDGFLGERGSLHIITDFTLGGDLVLGDTQSGGNSPERFEPTNLRVADPSKGQYVIDLSEWLKINGTVVDAEKIVRDDAEDIGSPLLFAIAESLKASIPELVKIPEPTRFGAVVKSATSWVRTELTSTDRWFSSDGRWFTWNELPDDVDLVFEGVE